MKEKHLADEVFEEFQRFKDEGKIRAFGISTHDRKLAGNLCSRGALDVIMMRYNAAHRGAEQDIFPFLATHSPGVVSYTATRWGYLLRSPKGSTQEMRIPTAGQCYRFVLSNPRIHVCLTAPSNIHQLRDNLDALELGPLSDEDMRFISEFGDRVRHMKKWFM
jgi:aryl-alcohol dehydrogenase-like predicted oxidoreductase